MLLFYEYCAIRKFNKIKLKSDLTFSINISHAHYKELKNIYKEHSVKTIFRQYKLKFKLMPFTTNGK
jgi:hypothetical protein